MMVSWSVSALEHVVHGVGSIERRCTVIGLVLFRVVCHLALTV